MEYCKASTDLKLRKVRVYRVEGPIITGGGNSNEDAKLNGKVG